MRDHHFMFAVKGSDHPRFDAMLRDLAECVLKQIGYAPPAIAEIAAKVREALEQGRTARGGECDVQFRAAAGQLIIVISYTGGREWRVTRALPD